MKYYAILVDRNDFTKEIEIEDQLYHVDIVILNGSFEVSFDDPENSGLTCERRSFYRNDDFLVSSCGKKAWAIFKEV